MRLAYHRKHTRTLTNADFHRPIFAKTRAFAINHLPAASKLPRPTVMAKSLPHACEENTPCQAKIPTTTSRAYSPPSQVSF